MGFAPNPGKIGVFAINVPFRADMEAEVLGKPKGGL
jgi:hypothetical protein